MKDWTNASLGAVPCPKLNASPVERGLLRTNMKISEYQLLIENIYLNLNQTRNLINTNTYCHMSNDLSRRSFLKTGTTAMLGLSVAPNLVFGNNGHSRDDPCTAGLATALGADGHTDFADART